MSELAYIGYIAADSRWTATITYQVTETEARQIVHHVEEIEDLQNLVERGPSFTAIRDFKIEYMYGKETIKEAMEG